MRKLLLGLLVVAALVVLFATLFPREPGSVPLPVADALPPPSGSAPVEPEDAPLGRGRVSMQSEQSGLLHVRVTDARSGVPLPGASVTLRSHGLVRSAASTDAMGAVSFPADDAMPAEISCEASGFASSSIALSEIPSLPVRMELHRLRVLRGRVRRSPSAPASDVPVHAWRYVDSVSLADFEELRDHPRKSPIESTRTDEHGEYMLYLRPDWNGCNIVAGGDGSASRVAEVRLSDDGTVQDLMLHPLHGLRISWRESGGGPIQTTSRLFWGSEPDFAREERSEESRALLWPRAEDQPALVVAGLRASEIETDTREEPMLVYYYVGDGYPESVGPVIVRRRIPGYHVERTALMLPRLTALGLQRAMIDAEPTASGWCELTLAFEPSCFGTSSGAPGVSSARFTLTELERGETYEFAIRSLSWSGDDHVGRVPHGTYSYRWETVDRRKRYPEAGDGLALLRLDQSSHVLEIDTTGLGCFDLTVSLEGKAYKGPLQLRYQPAKLPPGRMEHAASFHAPPYRVDSVLEGEYALAIAFPEELSLLAPVAVRVVAGELTQVVMEH